MKFFALTYKFFISHGAQKSLLSKAWDDISATNNFTPTDDLFNNDYVLNNTILWSYYEKVKSLETDRSFMFFNLQWENKSANKKDESWRKFVAKYPDIHENLNSNTKPHYERVFKYESRKERITTILSTIFYLIRDLVGSIILDAIDAVIIITEDIANIIVAKSLQFMSFCDRCKNSLFKFFTGNTSDKVEPTNEASPSANQHDNDSVIRANIDQNTTDTIEPANEIASSTNNEDDNDVVINANTEQNTTLKFSSNLNPVRRRLNFDAQGVAGNKDVAVSKDVADSSYLSLSNDPIMVEKRDTPKPKSKSLFELLSPFSQTNTPHIRPRNQSQ